MSSKKTSSLKTPEIARYIQSTLQKCSLTVLFLSWWPLGAFIPDQAIHSSTLGIQKRRKTLTIYTFFGASLFTYNIQNYTPLSYNNLTFSYSRGHGLESSRPSGVNPGIQGYRWQSLEDSSFFTSSSGQEGSFDTITPTCATLTTISTMTKITIVPLLVAMAALVIIKHALYGNRDRSATQGYNMQSRWHQGSCRMVPTTLILLSLSYRLMVCGRIISNEELPLTFWASVCACIFCG